MRNGRVGARPVDRSGGKTRVESPPQKEIMNWRMKSKWERNFYYDSHLKKKKKKGGRSRRNKTWVLTLVFFRVTVS